MKIDAKHARWGNTPATVLAHNRSTVELLKREDKLVIQRTVGFDSFHDQETYTPNDLRRIADTMELENVLCLELEVCNDYGDIELEVHTGRLETDDEHALRKGVASEVLGILEREAAVSEVEKRKIEALTADPEYQQYQRLKRRFGKLDDV